MKTDVSVGGTGCAESRDRVKLTKEMVLKLNPYPPASLGVAKRMEDVMLMPKGVRLSTGGNKTIAELAETVLATKPSTFGRERGRRTHRQPT